MITAGGQGEEYLVSSISAIPSNWSLRMISNPLNTFHKYPVSLLLS